SEPHIMQSCEPVTLFPSSDVVWIENDGPDRANADAAPLLDIGEVAARFGLTQRALRFYEGRGLLSPIREAGRRSYSGRDLDRLTLILRAKKLGFTLTEIAGMMHAGEGAKTGSLKLTRAKCAQQIETLERQQRETDAALCELRRIHTLLSSGVRG